MPTLTQFIYHLIYDKPYRNVFYYRVGRIHFLFSWLLPMEHAFNTFLNAKSIGDHFRCFHNVTLGQKNGKTPTIGNNVVVSCGASILGDCIIGDNVIIGAGCVVVKSVPANSTIIGNPAVIVKKEGIKTYELL